MFDDSARMLPKALGQRRDDRFSAAGNHHIRSTADNGMKGFTNGVRASSTGRDTAIIWPGRPETHRHVSAREIAEEHSRKEGRRG